MEAARYPLICLALLAGLGCRKDRPPVDPTVESAREKPAAQAVDAGVQAPSPDFDGNWFVLQPGQTPAQFAEAIGVPIEVVYTGEIVDRGEMIGEVGSTGISRGPHVHFELVHAGMNCNPEPLFRPGVKRRDGTYLDDVPKLAWTSERAPRGLRCAPRPRRHPRSRWVTNESPAEDADARSGLEQRTR